MKIFSAIILLFLASTNSANAELRKQAPLCSRSEVASGALSKIYPKNPVHFAEILLKDFKSLQKVLPILSPKDEEWLNNELNSNDVNRHLRATNSTQYSQDYLTKQIGNLIVSLEFISGARKFKTSRPAKSIQWGFLTAFLTRETMELGFHIKRLIDLKAIQKSSIPETFLMQSNYFTTTESFAFYLLARVDHILFCIMPQVTVQQDTNETSSIIDSAPDADDEFKDFPKVGERRYPVPANPQKDQKKVFTGTSFAVGKNLILTNAHVVDGCDRIRTINPKTVTSLLSIDRDADLALLETTGSFHDFATLGEADARTGEEILLAGYPLVGILGQDLNVTRGIVSSTQSSEGQYFTHTAPTQNGNSGGPILDRYGRVIGVAVAKLDDIKVLRLTGSIPQNINFGITAGVLTKFLGKNNIYSNHKKDLVELKGEEIAALASRFTFLIYCYHD